MILKVRHLGKEGVCPENTAKITGRQFKDPAHVLPASGQFFKRSDPLVLKPAWHYPFKMLQIGVDIKCKTVHCDPLPDGYAYGGDFIPANPDAGILFLVKLCFYIELILKQPDKNHTDVLYKTPDVAPVTVQIDDRIAYDLSRAMVGDIAASFDFIYRDIVFSQKICRGKYIIAAAADSKSDDGRMLQQYQGIADAAVSSELLHIALEFQGFGIIKTAGVYYIDPAGSAGSAGFTA